MASERLDLADVEAELAAVTSALAESRAEVDVLRRRLGGGSAVDDDPTLIVDPLGAVVGLSGWSWEDAPHVGDAVGALFDAESERTIRRLLPRQWIGVGEHTLLTRGGRSVLIAAEPDPEGFRLTLRDVTAARLLDLATEQRRRMRAITQLAAALARELTDPMSIVQGRLELLLELGVTDVTAVGRHLKVALEHSRRVAATLRNLRLVGRTTPPTEPVPLSGVVAEALDLVGPRGSQILVRLEPESLALGADPALTARVLASLVRQAIDGAARGSVHLRARRVRAHVVIRIGPSGRPIGEPLSEIDELSLDRTLLASVGGTLVARRAGSGAQYELTLPTPTEQRSRRSPARGRLLLVAPGLGEALSLLIERDGFEILSATSADEAEQLLGSARFEAVLAELILEDGDSGLGLAERVVQQWPHTKMIVVSEAEVPTGLLPPSVSPVRWPTSRRELLGLLGPRARS